MCLRRGKPCWIVKLHTLCNTNFQNQIFRALLFQAAPGSPSKDVMHLEIENHEKIRRNCRIQKEYKRKQWKSKYLVTCSLKTKRIFSSENTFSLMSEPFLTENYLFIGENPRLFPGWLVGLFVFGVGKESWFWCCFGFVFFFFFFLRNNIRNGSYSHVFLYFLSFFWVLCFIGPGGGILVLPPR